jgi:glycosyltransferase involved in cell wall biosynthesis
MPELIQPGVNGDLVPAEDFEALVRRVGGLIEDRRTLHELQDQLRSSGLDEQFTSESMLAHFRKILA